MFWRILLRKRNPQRPLNRQGPRSGRSDAFCGLPQHQSRRCSRQLGRGFRILQPGQDGVGYTFAELWHTAVDSGQGRPAFRRFFNVIKPDDLKIGPDPDLRSVAGIDHPERNKVI